MGRAPRVVLDTNVVLSALVFAQGRVAAIRRAWHDARCRPLASHATTAELIRALTYPKFGLSAEDQRQLLADYLPYCIAVRMPPKPPKTPACRDPLDVPFLRLAIAGKADLLVTGDHDLLALAGRFSCPIVAPNQLLDVLGKG
jgi:putative PIN family toxin of toxin-antitoxin system